MGCYSAIRKKWNQHCDSIKGIVATIKIWLIDWLIGWLIDWLIHWLMDWMIG